MKPIKIDTTAIDNAEARAAIFRRQYDDASRSAMTNPGSAYWAGKLSEQRAYLDGAIDELQAAKAALAETIQPALDAANGKATAHTVTDAMDVVHLARRAEAQLADAGLPKAFRKGAILHYRPAGPAANAYKYKAQTTRLTIERRGTAWYLTSVERDELYPKQAELFSICIAPDQAETIRKAAIRPFVVTEAA